MLLLKILCKQVAMAIRGYVKPTRIIGSLDPVFRQINDWASRAEFAGTKREELLRIIVESSRTAFCADDVALTLTDWTKTTVTSAALSKQARVDFRMVMRDSMTAAKVMNSGLVEVVEDLGSDKNEFEPELRELGMKAAICLPIFLERWTLGIMWILFSSRIGWRRYDHATLQRFSEEVSRAYQNWLGLDSLARQKHALGEIANADSFDSACVVLVKQVQKIFNGRTATFWPYDVRKASFEVSGVRYVGFKEALPEPTPHGVTYQLLQGRNHLLVEDVNDPTASATLGDLTKKFLQRNRIRSVQGMALYAGGEPLGVLYVGYEETQNFGFDRVRMLGEFSRDVAIILRAARQRDEWRHALEAASDVSGALTSGNLHDLLRSFSGETFRAIRCDSLMIFEYEESSRLLTLSSQDGESVAVNSPIMLGLSELLGSEDTFVAFTSTQKARFEEILPCASSTGTLVVFRLQYAARIVGLIAVIFNAELRKEDTDGVRELIRLMANHASVAIGTAHRLRALGCLSAKLLGCDSARVIQESAVATVVEQLRPDYCSLVFKEGNHLRCVAHHNWGEHIFAEIVEPGHDSHAGFVMLKRMPILFNQLDKIDDDPNLVGFNPPKRVREAKITSGIAVPIEEGEEIMGAMLAHTILPRQFTAEDVGFLSLVANQLMVAYRSARRLTRSEAHYEAAKWVAEASPFEREEVVVGSLLDIIWKNLKDEHDKSKLGYAMIELAGPGPVVIARGDQTVLRGMEYAIANNGESLGTLTLQTLPNREMDAEDRDIVLGVVSLLGLALKQCRQHRASIDRVAKLTI